ncbi:hypothetical protein HU200_014346 [Digitaria exilis]|uniref:RING-type E3 ubiquitin transferase n=1 Tax=Digitaria exilis TaxID=1010633 RepID=A0A835FBM9_9POAL|nr:hypothetical protein HU200_014346 [Digitaria exilis]
MDDTAAPRPSRYDITVETTGLDVTKLPDDGGKASVLVLHLDVKETHEWFGIGAGQRPRLRRSRSLVTNIQIALPPSRPDYLRSGGDFRRLLVVEARVAELAAAVSGSSPACCEVSFRVRVGFVFDEAAALLPSCRVVEPAAGGDGLTRRATSPCAICFEEMEATAWLPGCMHGFHGGCIGMWFEKASTCPVCRRDKLGYLPPAYKAARDWILSYPDEGSFTAALPRPRLLFPHLRDGDPERRPHCQQSSARGVADAVGPFPSLGTGGVVWRPRRSLGQSGPFPLWVPIVVRDPDGALISRGSLVWVSLAGRQPIPGRAPVE